MAKTVSYKIVLRGAKGGFAKIAQAKSYEIFYGKKKILKRTEFTKKIKLVKQKRSFLERLIKTIEKKRLETVEKIKKANKKKLLEKKFQKKEEKRRQTIVSNILNNEDYLVTKFKEENALFKSETPNFDVTYIKTQIETNVNFRQIQVIQYGAVDKEEIDPANARTEPPVNSAETTVSEVEILPFKPKSKYYDKELIYKEILKRDEQVVIISTTLKLELKEKYYIPITVDTFRNAKVRTFAYFLPHLRDFFGNMKQGNYILRVLFRRKVGDTFIQQGMSHMRHNLNKPDDINVVLNETMNRFIDPDERKARGGFIKHYLQESSQLEIVGFTFEQQDHYDQKSDRTKKLY